MSHRTSAQKHALQAACKLLEAEFAHVLVVASAEGDFSDDSQATDLDVVWKGPWPMASMMADQAKQRINYQRRNKSKLS